MNVSAGLTLGFIAIARSTFDIPLATELTAQARSQLTAAGFTLIGPDNLIIAAEDVTAAIRALNATSFDLLVVFQATFADSTMIMALVEAIDAPLIMWSVPEGPTGGRLRLNSLCGINLAGHALTRAGRQYDTIYAAADNDTALNKIRALAQAG